MNLITILNAWIGICGLFILFGFMFVDQTLSLLVGGGLTLMSLFGFSGYFIGRDVTQNHVLSKLNEAKEDVA